MLAQIALAMLLLMETCMRKIIQITSTGVDETSSTQCEAIFMALCDDGTLWAMNNRCMWNNNPWERVSNVPQDIQPTDRWER